MNELQPRIHNITTGETTTFPSISTMRIAEYVRNQVLRNLEEHATNTRSQEELILNTLQRSPMLQGHTLELRRVGTGFAADGSRFKRNLTQEEDERDFQHVEYFIDCQVSVIQPIQQARIQVVLHEDMRRRDFR